VQGMKDLQPFMKRFIVSDGESRTSREVTQSVLRTCQVPSQMPSQHRAHWAATHTSPHWVTGVVLCHSLNTRLDGVHARLLLHPAASLLQDLTHVFVARSGVPGSSCLRVSLCSRSADCNKRQRVQRSGEAWISNWTFVLKLQ
jgi:hypothetical protein